MIYTNVIRSSKVSDYWYSRRMKTSDCFRKIVAENFLTLVEFLCRPVPKEKSTSWKKRRSCSRRKTMNSKRRSSIYSASSETKARHWTAWKESLRKTLHFSRVKLRRSDISNNRKMNRHQSLIWSKSKSWCFTNRTSSSRKSFANSKTTQLRRPISISSSRLTLSWPKNSDQLPSSRIRSLYWRSPITRSGVSATINKQAWLKKSKSLTKSTLNSSQISHNARLRLKCSSTNSKSLPKVQMHSMCLRSNSWTSSRWSKWRGAWSCHLRFNASRKQARSTTSWTWPRVIVSEATTRASIWQAVSTKSRSKKIH